ncbi:FecR domain-containing protein [Pseudomonas chlororaphis]|uniref:FecR n=1 Tax=Pseudomonas chlororaphis TaxID=587753 RepID=A0AAX3FQD4_9PSED|nr:FecR family protein [Pseudomonas chlororaphis]AZC38406.1 Putative transmembrane sensor [Pseudomonas chlororaphis subsp. piscium]AZC44955.1 Putative transmembrane sensor [Pseudomonas chlororaphis subsp. piscium]WDG70549.1 FecR family protein [Pseudomonas chlororaphis]WDH31664.1 FecR family protein [Pseudomonas chlororaphis]WDH69075.1 FecR family protein [Pseudomonas chlororaphis]
MSRPRANEALVDEAAQWMALLQSGQMNAQERQAFHDWRAADPQHEQIIALMGGGLGALRSQALRNLSRDSLLHSLNAPSSRRRFIGGSLSVMALALAATLLGRRYGLLPEAGALYTGTGERRDFTLADGSALTLNARSQVVTRFDAQQRLLQLRNGQLLVDVARDPQRPFVVETEHGRMRALGTKFLVERGEDWTRLVMLHSQVEVLTASGARQVVEAGESLRFDGQRLLLLERAKGHESAWTSGVFEVRDRPLSEVIDSLRGYRRGIIRLSPQVADLRLSGIYPLDDSDRSLQLLERSLPIRVSYHSSYWVSIEPR